MKKRGGKIALRICFALYCALMLWLLFIRNRHNTSLTYDGPLALNLIPFLNIRRFIRVLGQSSDKALLWHATSNLFGNVGLFLPLGLFLPAVFPKLRAFWRTLLCTILIICTIEVIQMLTLLGICDIDDLILNTLGSGIGYLIYRIFNPKKKQPQK